MLDKILTKQIIAPILIIFISIILWVILNHIINNLFKIKIIDGKKQKTIAALIKNIIKVFLITIAILMIMDVYGIDTKSLVTSLGVVGLVAGLALQDLLKDFITGMSIIFENQYCIGDIVTINGFQGEVIYLSMKSTRVKSFKGEIRIFANRTITEIINHSIANSLAIVDIAIAYNSDLNKIEKVLNETCEKLTKSLSNLKSDITCLGIQKLSESAIIYRIVVETAPMEQYEIERILRKELIEVLEKNKIEVPFPQLVIHNA
ncbi:MAG: mechanosensitive ion channel [Bacilli bacterium]